MAERTAENDVGTRQRLLKAAVEEFAKRGFDGATVRDICGRAAANVNAVKYYFQDKRGLYIASLQHAHRMSVQRGLQEAPPEGPPCERLKWFIGGMVRTMLDSRQDAAHHMLLMREIAAPTEATEAIVRTFIRPRFQMLNDILAELLPSQVSAMDRRLLAFSVIGQCMHYKVAMPVVRMLVPRGEAARYTAAKLADHIHAVTMAAIAERRSAASLS